MVERRIHLSNHVLKLFSALTELTTRIFRQEELLNAIVVRVGDIDVAMRVETETRGPRQLVLFRAIGTGACKNASEASWALTNDTIVAAIGDKHVSVGVEHDCRRVIKRYRFLVLHCPPQLLHLTGLEGTSGLDCCRSQQHRDRSWWSRRAP